MMKRRQFVQGMAVAGSLGALSLLGGCASTPGRNAPKVVVIGGGFGGATAAKYLRLWSDYGFDVTLVEPGSVFVSCPLSNLVVGGSKGLGYVILSYDTLVRRHGVRWVQDRATRIDPDKRVVHLANGAKLPYDRLIVSPGVDFMWETLPGMAATSARDNVLHAWKAGAQTLALRDQLEEMPDGGVFAMTLRARPAAGQAPTGAPARWPPIWARPSRAARC